MITERFVEALLEYFEKYKNYYLYSAWIRGHLEEAGIDLSRVNYRSWILTAMKYLIGKYQLTGNRFLDVGCGMGELVVIMAIEGYDAMGVDVDPRALKVAKALSNENGRKGDFVCCDASHLPFRQGSFDAITMFHIVEHLEDPIPVLLEIRNISKTRGVCYATFPNKLRLLDDHTGLYLSPLLPRKLAEIYIKLRGRKYQYAISYGGGWDVYYRTYQHFLRITGRYFIIKPFPTQLIFPPIAHLDLNFMKFAEKLSELGISEPNLEPYINVVLVKRSTLKNDNGDTPSLLVELLCALIWPLRESFRLLTLISKR